MSEDRLIGLAELTEMVNRPKTTVHAWTKRASFPAPVAELRSGPVWSCKQVNDWLKSKDRAAAAKREVA